MKTSVAVELNGLSKRYGRNKFALEDLTLHVDYGEVYGFLGPNGAGKSTAIRTLLNFIRPTGGSAKILGKDSVRESRGIKSEIGYLAGEIALYDRLTGKEFLDYMRSLQPVKHEEYLDHLVASFQARLDQPIETLSKGNKQKLGILQAFMHEPEVLILDEPTSGLDPLMQSVFYKTVAEARERGAAIFLSSHDLAEVRKMCDRIGFIRGGKLITESTIAELQETASHSFDITFRDEPPLAQLKKLKGYDVTPLGGTLVRVSTTNDLTPLFKLLAAHPVAALDQHVLDLDGEFMRLYEPGVKETT